MTIVNMPLKQLLRISSHSLTLSIVLAFPLLLLGCPSTSNKSSEANSATPATNVAKSDFDGDRAFEHVRKQVEFGPRPAGSAELEKARGYIIDQLKSYGLKVTTDEFHATTPLGDRRMVNVIAELPGESSDAIIIGSHYDTKYFKEFKFVGANDAGKSSQGCDGEERAERRSHGGSSGGAWPERQGTTMSLGATHCKQAVPPGHGKTRVPPASGCNNGFVGEVLVLGPPSCCVSPGGAA